MDLYAYAQIEELEELAKQNGIEVPRLRGYRLMSEEELITKEELDEAISESYCRTVEDLCESVPFWDPNASYSVYSGSIKRMERRYIDKDNNEIKWENIHGWKRRVLKFELKKAKKKVLESFNTFNKYVGQNVLYIHARIGGGNWEYYNGDKLTREPWFLEKVDDCFGSTYCDIYAKIKPEKEL